MNKEKAQISTIHNVRRIKPSIRIRNPKRAQRKHLTKWDVTSQNLILVMKWRLLSMIFYHHFKSTAYCNILDEELFSMAFYELREILPRNGNQDVLQYLQKNWYFAEHCCFFWLYSCSKYFYMPHKNNSRSWVFMVEVVTLAILRSILPWISCCLF